MTFDRTAMEVVDRGGVYLGTNGSRDSSIVKASEHVGASCERPAMPLWRPERYNDNVGEGGSNGEKGRLGRKCDREEGGG